MLIHGGEEFGGKYYDDLPKETQDSFLNYSISVDLLIGASDVELLDIFARLNTYGVRLNKQELINAKYFGHFKQTVYSLGYEFYHFWVENKILSEQDVARMLEAELVSELVISMLWGIQSRKVVERYYRENDDEFAQKPIVIERFKQCMDLIGEITENKLRTSNFSSTHLFYSLYCAVYDLLYGLPESSIERVEFDSKTIARVSATLWDIDALFESELIFIKDKDMEFMGASTKRTTDLSARQIRHQYIVSRIIRDLQSRSVTYMLGIHTASGFAPVRYVSPHSEQHALDMVLAGRDYFPWTAPEATRRQSIICFQDGEPFRQILDSTATELQEINTVRNAVVHRSRKALEKLKSLVRDKILTAPPDITPASFLLKTKSGTANRTYLTHYCNKLIVIANKIAPA